MVGRIQIEYDWDMAFFFFFFLITSSALRDGEMGESNWGIQHGYVWE